ncbi:MAG: diacylglycerol kinase family lipid kinase [Chloroflexota bacterium]|nr:diacylglycerol kinase family lipid kinase [Chloroflexota bacterium]
MTQALVLGRRRKGRKIGQAVRETRMMLEAAGWKVEGRLVDRKKDLRRHAARGVKQGVDVFVAVGGDGAVLQVVNAVAGTEVALGIVPRGTGNLLAGNLGIPHRLDKAVEVLVKGQRRRIDLGRVRVGGKDHDFAVACGVGFDADVMKVTQTSEKRRWGKLAYIASALSQGHRLRDVTHKITIDGVSSTTEAAQVFVANFGRMGPFEPRREVDPQDGLLDVIVVRARGPLSGLLAGWEALRQRDLGESSNGHVFRAQAREVRIETDPRRLVETDGTIVGKTPIDVSVRPAALTVISNLQGGTAGGGTAEGGTAEGDQPA